MDTMAFDKSDSGILVPTIKGMKAFLPNELPPNLQLENLASEIAEAAAALGGLAPLLKKHATVWML